MQFHGKVFLVGEGPFAIWGYEDIFKYLTLTLGNRFEPVLGGLSRLKEMSPYYSVPMEDRKSMIAEPAVWIDRRRPEHASGVQKMLWTIRLNQDLASFEAPLSSNSVQIEPAEPIYEPQIEPPEPIVELQIEPPEPINEPQIEPPEPIDEPQIEPAEPINEPQSEPPEPIDEPQIELVEPINDPQIESQEPIHEPRRRISSIISCSRRSPRTPLMIPRRPIQCHLLIRRPMGIWKMRL